MKRKKNTAEAPFNFLYLVLKLFSHVIFICCSLKENVYGVLLYRIHKSSWFLTRPIASQGDKETIKSAHE